ncbi:MAG: hypothetical protein OES79_02030 [Planctomycetota bacterium]|nr:hypothetical protein [Planctomycetota bacterium]
MVPRIKSAIILGILAFVIGFCFVSGAYIAHDLWRTVDDENVIWLVNRSAAGYVITMFVILGFVTARGIEFLAVRWWKSRHRPKADPRR